MPEYEPFCCVVERTDGRATVRLGGELDLAGVPELEAAITATADAQALVLDLSGLTFIDSSGMRLLLSLNASVQERGQSFEVVPGSENVQRTFELAGLLDRLPFQRPEGSSSASGSG